MAVTINGKTYRNLQEQVEKNMEDIQEAKFSLNTFDCEEAELEENEELAISGISEAINEDNVYILENIDFVYNGDTYRMKRLSLLNEINLGTTETYRAFVINISAVSIDNLFAILYIDNSGDKTSFQVDI